MFVWYLALAGDDLVFIHEEGYQNSDVVAVPTAGGAPRILASEPVSSLVAIDGLVYFQQSTAPYAMKRVDPDGGSPEVVGGALGYGSAVLDGAWAYVTTVDGIGRAAVEGGALELLVPVTGVDSGNLAQHGDSLYFTRSVNHGMYSTFDLCRAPKAGGAAEVLATWDVDTPYHLQVSEAGIFWSEQRSVRTLPLAGGEPTTFIEFPVPARIRDLVLEADSALVALDSSAGLYRVGLDEGEAEQLVEADMGTSWLAVDATHIYFVYDVGTLVTSVPAIGKVHRCGCTP